MSKFNTAFHEAIFGFAVDAAMRNLILVGNENDALSKWDDYYIPNPDCAKTAIFRDRNSCQIDFRTEFLDKHASIATRDVAHASSMHENIVIFLSTGGHLAFESCNSLQEVHSGLVLFFKNQSIEHEVRKKIGQNILLRHRINQRALKARSTFDDLVRTHRAERTFCYFSSAFLGNDVVAAVVEFLPIRNRPVVKRLCREMAEMPQIAVLLPHLRVRAVEGSFPHVITVSSEQSRSWYLAKNSVAHVYIDFVVEGTKACNYVKKQCEPKRTYATYVRDVRLRTAPDEPDPSGRRERIPHEEFFISPIECFVEMVTLNGDIVVGDDGDPALRLTLESTCNAKPTKTFTANGTNALPAKVSFKLNKLSNGESCKFCLRVTGVATMADGSTTTLKTLSTPFIIVAHKRTAEGAPTQLKKRQAATKKTAATACKLPGHGEQHA